MAGVMRGVWQIWGAGSWPREVSVGFESRPRSLTLGERERERDCETQAKAGDGVLLLCNPRRAVPVQLEPSQPALHLQSLSRNCPALGVPEGREPPS